MNMYVNTLAEYIKNEFGEKIYKITLDGGMSCPNRDGTCGDRGCIFCSESGSGEFAQSRADSIEVQIEKGKELIKDKSVSNRCIAYFQPYSNTYAPVYCLRELFEKVIYRDDIAALSVATRPDCINEENLKLLEELNKIKPVWVELGLQTSNENTAEYIRRGYKNQVYVDSAVKLRNTGCHVITHLILGLSDETVEDNVASAKFAGKYSDGIKFHTLYVAKGTDLEKEYAEKRFDVLSKEEYIDRLCRCLRVVPKNVVIHRVTGDAEKSTLVAPMWTADKKKVLRDIHNAFVDRNVVQGELL